MHWVTRRAPPTRRCCGSPRAPAVSCAPSRASAASARTSAGRCRATRSTASTSPSSGSASTRRRPRQGAGADPGGRRRLPRASSATSTTYLKERIKEVLAGASEAIVVRIFGPDIERSATRPRRCIRRSRGSAASSTCGPSRRSDVPHIDVQARPEKAAKYGLKPGDVRRAAATLVAGDEVGDSTRDQKIYDVFVWGVPGARRDVPSSATCRSRRPAGATCRCRTWPTWRSAHAEPDLARGHSRRIDVV